MTKKYELIPSKTHKNLYRVKYLRRIPMLANAGDIGGYVASEKNLSHDGDCCILQDAVVRDDAMVVHDAVVSDDARVMDYAKICGRARIDGNAYICDNAIITDFANVTGYAVASGSCVVQHGATLMGNARVSGRSRINLYSFLNDNDWASGRREWGNRLFMTPKLRDELEAIKGLWATVDSLKKATLP